MPGEIIVDLFAGGGGASAGIAAALGRHPDIAVNHDATAIAVHAANHPGTHHECASVWHVEPRAACAGRPVGLLWASPDCRHFSRAAGGRPKWKSVRSLPGVVLTWAARVRPRLIVVENVREFLGWGPLLADGTPCPDRIGRSFNMWVGRLRGLGYRVQWRELCAADFGVPTTRTRLFVAARCDNAPIAWPQPTHRRGGGLLERAWRGAAEIIDWSLPVPSIFTRARPLAEATLRRIDEGRRRYGVTRQPFLIRYNGMNIGQPIDRPLGTATTIERFALVRGDGMRMLTWRELAAAQGFPAGYVLDRGADGVPLSKRDIVRLIGNSVCPAMAEAVVRANRDAGAAQIGAAA